MVYKMLTILLLSCVTMGSAVPVLPSDLPPEISQTHTGQPLDITNQTPDAQTPAPQVEQLQPGVPLQPGTQAQNGLQFLPPTQFYVWYPLGGGPMFLQPSTQGSTINQPSVPQQPLFFSPFGYFPFHSSPYMSQQFSPYGFNMPQNLAIQTQNSPALPAETPAGASPVGNAPQSQQQQQNTKLVYMLQQSMNLPVGSLSSEELEMAANRGQLGVYLTSVLTSAPVNANQPVNQAAGLKNPEQQNMVPTVETSSAGVAVTQGLQLNTNAIPAGLEGPTQAAATDQAPVHAEIQPTQANLV